MNRLLLLLLVGCLALAGMKLALRPAWAGAEPDIRARAYMLLDAKSGLVLAERRADEALPPANMSKMMTELVVLSRVAAGQLRWDEPVVLSEYAAAFADARFDPRAGETFTVRELFEAMLVDSANGAAIALAEHAAGSETAFVAWMNEQARLIGMSGNTVFANASGLPSAELKAYPAAAAQTDTVMTARDAATLAAYLMMRYPQVPEERQRDSTPADDNAPQRTSGGMLPWNSFARSGSVGLKGGYAAGAGYCLTGTAKRGGKRLVAVVMGATTSEAQVAETKRLLQFGFHQRRADIWLARLKSFL